MNRLGVSVFIALNLGVAAFPTWAQSDQSVDGGMDTNGVVANSYRALARRLHRHGIKLTEQSRYPEALKALKEAYSLDPKHPEISLSLGYVHTLLGNRAAAERRLRAAISLDPDRLDAVQQLAELLASEESSPYELAEAAQLLEQVREGRGNTVNIIRQQARVSAIRGLESEASEFYRQLLQRQPIDDDIAIEIGEFYSRLGKLELGISWYRRAILTDEGRTKAAQAIRRLELEQSARRFGWSLSGRGTPREIRQRIEIASRQLEDGRFKAARDILESTVKRVPTYARAYALLGDAHRGLGDTKQAENAYLNAVVYDSAKAQYALRLAELYESGKKWAQAAEFLGRVLQLKPHWREAHLRRAQALRSAGDLAGALHQVEFALSKLSEDEPRDAFEDLGRRIRGQLPAPTRMDSNIPRLDSTTARARAHLAAGNTAAALTTLRDLKPADRTADVLVLEAAILEITGRTEDALELYRRSLTIAPELPEALESLGLLLGRLGRHTESMQHLEKASRGGSTVAKLAVIQHSLRDRIGIPVVSDLVDFFALKAIDSELRRMSTSRDHFSHSTQIERLSKIVNQRMSRAYVTTIVLIGVFVFAPIGIWYRRKAGLSIEQFVDRAPGASIDVQRILSAIRHEVLKHNTTALSGLTTAMKDGADVTDRVSWIRDSLLGNNESEGAIERLAGYVNQLTELARTHRCRLNLRHRDPGLKAILIGFNRIWRHRRDFDRIALGRPPSRQFINMIERASALINGEGYRSILHVLHRLRVLNINEALVRHVFDGVRREPAFEGLAVTMDWLASPSAALPCDLAIPQQDFEDCLRNPMRNAIQATSETFDEQQTIPIGLKIERETEPVTGISYLVCQIFDQCPTILDRETIEGRSVEAGLGLTRQLINRYEGSISIEDSSAPWTKAIALRFPVVEGTSIEWNL